MIKIKFNSLVRTNLGFPSLFEGALEDGTKVKFHFRFGKLTLTVNDAKIDLEHTSLDQFDVGGFLEDEDLKKLMKLNNILDEQT